MLELRPTTATRSAPPILGPQDRGLGTPDDRAVLEAVPPQDLLNQEDTAWEVPAAEQPEMPEAAIIRAANYYRGAFIDIVA